MEMYISVLLISIIVFKLTDAAIVSLSPNPAFVPLAPCPCDLTENQFDTNCCCDLDASPDGDDITISNCDTGAFGGDGPPGMDELCGSNVTHNDDWYPLLCVYYLNTPSLGYFYVTAPEGAQDISVFASTTTQTSYSYEDLNVTSITACDSGSCYISGDAILDDENDIIVFPQNAQSGNCMRGLPINYLEDTVASCSVIVDDTTCAGGSVLDHAIYAITTINRGQNTTATTVTTTVKYLDAGSNPISYVNSNTGIGDTLTESLFPGTSTSTELTPSAGDAISGNGVTCQNTAVKVVYAFTWNGQQITALDIGITLADVSYTTLPSNPGEVTENFIIQRFETTFTNSGAASATVERSGNPGYEFGLPVISGSLDATNSINASVENQLRIWSPGADGRCSDSTTISPSFGYDVIIGCNLLISSYDCGDLLTLVEVQQEKMISSADSVARYGNPAFDDTSEWVQVIRNLSTSTAGGNTTEGQCNDIPAETVIEFLWSKTGEINGVDINEIVGVKTSWRRETWTLPCTTGNVCSPAIFSVYSSVTFTKIPPQKPEPVLSSEVVDTKSCERDSTCWPELLLPLQYGFYANFYPADVAKSLADQNTAWAVLIALFVIGFTLIPQNWKRICEWSRQFFPI